MSHVLDPLARLWAKCGAPATFPREAEALAYCQVEAYADDPPAPPALPWPSREAGPEGEALADLVGVIQGLLDLRTIDDVTGDLAQWSAQWGYPLHFAPLPPGECA